MSERERIKFVVGRDGLEKAEAWAKQTLSIYSAGLSGTSDSTAWMRSKDYRPTFEESCMTLKQFLSDFQHLKESRL